MPCDDLDDIALEEGCGHDHHEGSCHDFCLDRTDPYAMFARPRFQGRGNDGRPLSGGRVKVYVAATSTPMESYNSPSMSAPNTWPVILDSGGWADIWWAGPAKIVLEDCLGNRQWTVDNYLGFGGWVCKRPTGSTSGLVLASDTDTTAGTLSEKLTTSDGLTSSVVTNDAGAQTVNISGQPILDQLTTFEDDINGQLSDFENTVNGDLADMKTALESEIADIKIVSVDANNIITPGSDNGAYLSAQTVENLVTPLLPVVPPATTLSNGPGITITSNGSDYQVAIEPDEMCALMQSTCPSVGPGNTGGEFFSKVLTLPPGNASQSMTFTTSSDAQWRIRITAVGTNAISAPQFSAGSPTVMFDETIGTPGSGPAIREMMYSTMSAGTYTLTIFDGGGGQPTYLVDVMTVGSTT